MNTTDDMPVAIVTGASKGIGRACAEAFAERGYRVVANARSATELEDLARSIAGAGGHCRAVTGDVADPATADALAAAVQELGGRCDVLLNCAGMQPLVNEVENLPLDDWHHTIAANLTGTFLVCRRIVPLMKSAGRGRIINVASGLAKHVQPGLSAYSAAKAAVVQFSAVLAAEAADSGVTVLSAHPGVVDTDIVRQNLADTRPGVANQMITRLERLKREGLLISPRQSARFLVWLASAEIETGSFVRADDPAHADKIAEYWRNTA
ncbi:SDR family NAD(P)-dependent oxidoreductase [Rhodoligotrophos defluvii]|uniref:SDR family NAD(P)-dependent oxidoreductase n=1 Tax=Rhodoligotrophos defluvii TaxID=2561934 RepID=UPI0010C9ED2C|nr:SDR family oxidoreductase [Rhodoligotrophos defluvii]